MFPQILVNKIACYLNQIFLFLHLMKWYVMLKLMEKAKK